MAEAKDVYTFSDLKDWAVATAGLDHPAKLSVIGDPIVHSRSPQMHNPALRAAGIDAEYVRVHLSPEELVDGLGAMKSSGFIGTNVTIPHKGGVFDAVDEMTEVARRIGAVNTVAIDGDQLIGHNTDAPGLKRAIREEFSMDLTDLRIMIIGAGGGAGKAAAVQCAMDHCDRLVLVNRTIAKAEALEAELEELFVDPDRLEGPADRLVSIPWEEKAMERELGQVDLIINATSVGMKRTDAEVVPQRLIEPHHLVYDMIYAPPRTRLINDAEAAGAKAANGLSMLLWQGVLAFEFWFNREAPVDAMRQGLNESLA
ncbi:MAG: shikimate dehydrogenase [Verrucomicrobiales bacterium]|nr:shikimate dehydrogenase [Verrucomicrobiales bacterium]